MARPGDARGVECSGEDGPELGRTVLGRGGRRNEVDGVSEVPGVEGKLIENGMGSAGGCRTTGGKGEDDDERPDREEPAC